MDLTQFILMDNSFISLSWLLSQQYFFSISGWPDQGFPTGGCRTCEGMARRTGLRRPVGHF